MLSGREGCAVLTLSPAPAGHSWWNPNLHVFDVACASWQAKRIHMYVPVKTGVYCYEAEV